MWKKKRPVEASKTAPKPVEGQSLVGGGLIIKGDLSAEESVIIQGLVEGNAHVKQHTVMIGEKGQVKGNVSGNMIVVEGKVEGNLYGEKKIIIRRSGDVRGNLSAPRVDLKYGCKFKGEVNVDDTNTYTDAGGKPGGKKEENGG